MWERLCLTPEKVSRRSWQESLEVSGGQAGEDLRGCLEWERPWLSTGMTMEESSEEGYLYSKVVIFSTAESF